MQNMDPKRRILTLLLLLLILPAGWLRAQERKSPRMKVLPLNESAGFNDEPSMALANDGSLYVAWVSFRDNADTLQIARYKPDGG